MEQTEEKQEALTGRTPAPRWLRALCDREWKIPAPIAVELDGKRWIAAVTHCQVVAIRSDAEADEAPADIAEKLSAWLSQPTPIRIPRDAIRVAISTPLPSEGFKDEWPIEIAGATFNARLLRRALRHLPVGDEVAASETVTSEDGNRPPIFAGDGWRIALMPLWFWSRWRNIPAPLARFRREGDRIVLDALGGPQSREAPTPKPIAAKPPAPAKPAPLADAPTVPMVTSDCDAVLASVKPIADAADAVTGTLAAEPVPIPRMKPRAGALRVYVAAPKAEVMRARRVAAQLRAIEGVEVMSSWHDVIGEGAEDPTSYHELKSILDTNLAQLECANWVVALTRKGAGAGVYGEIGRALAAEKWVLWSVERGGHCQDRADDRVIEAATDAQAIQIIRTLAAWRRAA